MPSLQLCLTLCNPVNCSHPGSSVHGILEWVAIHSSRESSQPRDPTCVACLLHWQAGSLPLVPPGKIFEISQSVQSLSWVTQLCLTLCNPMDCSTPALPVHYQLPEPTQTQVHWVGDAFQPFHPLSSCHLLLLPSTFASIRVFSNESVLCIRWPKYWSFNFKYQSFQWLFRTDFL